LEGGAAATLGNRPAALMRGHGAVVVGDSIQTVVGRSVYLDINARAQAQAMALGGQIAYLDPEEARLYVAPNNYDRAWELWKKQVSR
jgi:ribulose-5-phosphate 4-epimerase/fuculose-1-phosphate aldolase